MTLNTDQLATVCGGINQWARRKGNRVGFNGGVAVTRALGLSPSYSEQVPGMPKGYEVRHIPTIGPKISAFANKLMPGPVHDFFFGMGQGATAAPTWTFREGM